MKTICFFGLYNPDYSRNKVLITGFKKNGWRVIECQVNPRQFSGWRKYWQLLLIRKNITESIDLVLVAYPGQTAVWLAKLLFWNKTIVFDAFTSLFDSNVFDRQRYKKNSWRGWRDWLLDWYSLVLADKNLVDTWENGRYFQKTFKIKATKFIRVFVGSEISEEKIENSEKSLNSFLIHFHGHYIPLQGIEYIIRAAKILENDKEIKFRIIGGGQEYKKIQEIVSDTALNNIDFWSESSMAVLAKSISEADLVLGIFGITPKAGRVIPNKVFEGLALGKAILTADTQAIKELLTDEQNVLLCQAGNPEDLAIKIVKIKNDSNLRTKLGLMAKDLFDKELNTKKIVSDLVESLN